MTNPPSTAAGGGIFFDFPNPIVVIITDVKMIKKIICGYASAFGKPIVIGYVASTAAANPLGIIELVTALSSLENLFVRVIFPTNILPPKTAIVIKTPNTTYSTFPKLAINPTNTKKNDLTKNVS